MLSGDRSLARRAACSGVTRCPAGTDSPAVRSVIGRSSSPPFAGRKKFPVYVAPGSRRIVSPGRAAFSARCKSPPAGTVTVAADGSPDIRKRTSAVRSNASCLMRESSGKRDAGLRPVGLRRPRGSVCARRASDVGIGIAKVEDMIAEQQTWERAEVARSASEAMHTPDARLIGDEANLARYLNPPMHTVYPLEYAYALL